MVAFPVFTGVDDVFSGERNFFEAYAPVGHPERLFRSFGERFEIMGTNIRKWSVGSPAQSRSTPYSIDAAERIAVDPCRFYSASICRQRSARTVDNAPMPDVNVQHLLPCFLD